MESVMTINNPEILTIEEKAELYDEFQRMYSLTFDGKFTVKDVWGYILLRGAYVDINKHSISYLISELNKHIITMHYHKETINEYSRLLAIEDACNISTLLAELEHAGKELSDE